MIYFTSDTHLFHKSVLTFCNRPFSNEHEMNEYLIEAWNKTVNANDTVYHLGDLSFGSLDETAQILEQLKGDIILIKGNHDPKSRCKRYLEMGLIKEFKVADYMKFHKKQLWLTHIPLDIELSRGAMWNLSGHIHDKSNKSLKQINVGIDSPLYNEFPEKGYGEAFSIDEILHTIKSREN